MSREHILLETPESCFFKIKEQGNEFGLTFELGGMGTLNFNGLSRDQIDKLGFALREFSIASFDSCCTLCPTVKHGFGE